MGTDSAEVRCSVDAGRLTVATASPDIGQGLHAGLAQVVAAEWGVAPSLVDVVCDTGLADLGTAASRGSYLTANAALAAVQALRAAAAERLGAGRPPVVGGRLDPVLDGLVETRSFGAPDNGLVAGAQLVQVEVDCETGHVRPLRVVSVHDTGRVLSHTRARGQVRGGVMHGLGMALAERLCFDESGAVADATLLGQGMPTAAWDVPVEAQFVDDPHPNGGLGVKGLGEAPAMGIMPALANAIHDATGARLRAAPFTPERVLAALAAAGRELPDEVEVA
jgi:CO/xanthine dehydrogenase Mo-binding subunit